MLKTLIKKEFYELTRSLFVNHKTGKIKSNEKVIATIFFGLLSIVFICAYMANFANTLCPVFLSLNLSWVYFAITSGMALMLGAIITAFSANATLYQAKDNELLLALPIRPRDILISRTLSVFAVSLLCTLLVLAPTTVVYFINAKITFLGVVCSFALIITVSLLTLSLSLTFGFIISKITSKLKNKTLIRLIFSLAFIGLYYFLYAKAMSLLAVIPSNGAYFADKFSSYAFPLMALGKLAVGDLIFTLLVPLCVVIVCALVTAVLALNFNKMLTYRGGEKRNKRAVKIKASSLNAALLKKEFGKYFSSANYILNSSLATLLLLVASVGLLIKLQDARLIISALSADSNFPFYLALFALIFATSCMNNSAASAISLEGKGLWQIKSLPVSPLSVMHAKISVQVIVTLPAILLANIVVCIVVKANAVIIILSFLICIILTLANACFNLTLNLLKPTFNFTNEVYVIKQGAPAFFSLFGGMALIGGFSLIVYLLRDFLTFSFAGEVILSALLFLVSAALIALILYLKNKGVKKFLQL